MEYALTENQVNEFRDRGYLILRQLYTPTEIKLIEALEDDIYTHAIALAKEKVIEEYVPSGTMFSFDLPGPNEHSSACVRAVANLDDTVSIRYVSWIGGIHAELVRLGRLRKLTIPMAQLLRTRIADHLVNQAHYKMPRDKVKFDWHQDVQYRRTVDPDFRDVNGTGSFVQVITAVDESNAYNSGLVIVPNSHRSFLGLDKADTVEEKETIVRAKYDIDSEAITLDLKPGDSVFLHPLVLHKSDVNVSDKSRKIFMNGYSVPGANTRPNPGRGSGLPVDLGVPEILDLTP